MNNKFDNIKSVRFVVGPHQDKILINNKINGFSYTASFNEDIDGEEHYANESIFHNYVSIDNLLNSSIVVVEEMEKTPEESEFVKRFQEYHNNDFAILVDLIVELYHRYNNAYNASISTLTTNTPADNVLIARQKEGLEVIKHIVSRFFQSHESVETSNNQAGA